MNRAFFACASPLALFSGMLLVHCSSSSTTGTSSSTTSASTTHEGSSSSGETSASTSGGSQSSQTSATGTSSKSATTSSSATSTATGNDEHDAGPCVGPANGAACDPGNVECNNAQCAVPGHTCCIGTGSGSPESCIGVTAMCSGNTQACDEKSDCPDNQICCLTVTDLNGDFKISCQSGTTCPGGGLATAQICKTSAECGAGGQCSLYNCQGQITEACQAPNALDCTKM